MKNYRVKCIFTMFLILLMLLYSFTSVYSEEDTGLLTYEQLFSEDLKPVMLSYIASEYNCRLVNDRQNKKVSIVNKEGNVIKIYEDVAFFYNEPILNANTLEFDLGWTFCNHVPDRDIFINETHALIAGWFAYLQQSNDTEFTYHIGKCYTGYYFTLEQGNHEKLCRFEAIYEDIHKDIPVVIENGYLKSYNGISVKDNPEVQEAVIEEIQPVFEQLNFNLMNLSFERIIKENPKPVILKYILQKNKYTYNYNARDQRVSIFNQQGELITNYRYTPFFNNEIIIDSSILERSLNLDDSVHQADTDMFERESDAVVAGWLKYFKQSEKTKLTFYTGSCYSGHYFSQTEGSHKLVCKYESVLEHMHNDVPITIENGRLIYYNTQDNMENKLYDYAYNKKTRIEAPDPALTKMVTVFYTEYAKKEGVQTNYYSYRDRVYRDYWEDLAGYDATDYIFIPPYLTESEESLSRTEKIRLHKNENDKNLEDMVNAIKSLLKHKKNAKIWVGTPKALHYISNEVVDEIVIDFLDKIQRKLGNDIWSQNVAGMYFSQEALFGDDSQQQVQIKRIKKIVDHFKEKNDTKEALWIPYYEQSAEKIHRISKISDLFDHIIIQPGYFFLDASAPEATRDRKQNLDAVKFSAQNNYISDSLGNAVKGEYSNTKIGMELEIQASYFSFTRATRFESIDRYTDYLRAAVTIKDSNPTAFYSPGEPHCNKEYLIYKFYDADKLNGSNAVKKRLDNGLYEYFDYVFATREKEQVFYDYAKQLYLATDISHTEEEFSKAYKPELIIIEFYLFEKLNGIKDLSEHITENNKLPDYFDKKILKLLANPS